MSRWQIPQAVVLFCSALLISACDDVLEGKDDRPHEEDDPGCCSSGGGGPSHGGGSDPDDPDDPDYPDDPDDPDYPDADAPRVEVSSGELVGRYENSKVRAFLGIPYAEPPTGNLRFLAPREADSWSKPREAVAFEHSCIQSAGEAALDDQSEDCLYLNVWAPTRKVRQGLPVFVWFHGGEHAGGSAAEPLGKRTVRYDGTKLAEQGVIVVSVNYRLGPLGFFAHEQLAEADGGTLGNQGLWDQQLALRWVSENAASFGGDEDNVTIAGQGSGASDVCLHVVSPASRGLFAHVVQQSGGCTTYQPTAAELQTRAQPWLDALDCDGDDVLDCLQDHDLYDLYQDLPGDSYKAFVPNVDADFVPDQPRVLFDQGEIADVSFLMGSNSEEGSVYFDQFPDVTTEDELHVVMQELFPEIPLKELCEAYPHDRFAGSDAPYQTALSFVLGDGHFVCSTLDTAIRAQEAGANVYLYNFEGTSLEDIGDAQHGAEVPYVFGTLSDPDDEEAALSKQIQAYWTQFARAGDPDDGSSPTWVPLTSSKRWRINLSSELSVLKSFRDAECALWSSFYDSQFEQ
jgi:para-nitrobenzyl esterase